jgi:hypothetical protein
MQFSIRLLGVCSLLAAIIALAGCGDSSHSAASHLYVGNNATPGQVLQFALPLTNHSGATAVVANSATNDVVALALDPAGNLTTGDSAGHLAIYTAPFGNSSTPSTSFNNGPASNSGQLLFNGTGDLFAATAGPSFNLFSHPLSSSSTPSNIIHDKALNLTTGVAIDGNGNLIISNAGTGSSNLVVCAPVPQGLTPNVTFVTPAVNGARYRHLAISNNQVFVASATGGTGQIDVYSLPLSSTSAPAFSMTNVNVPETVAFDSSGNLYVGNAGDHTIRVFPPPFSASSTPNVTLTLSSTFDIEAVAIGR